MKKSKFLIPALSVASVGAVVAPMVTSCAKANGISFELFKDSKLQKYTPMKPVAASQVEFKTTSKATAAQEAMVAYARAVQSNPNIFADDHIYATYAQYDQVDAETAPKSLKLTVSDISVSFLKMNDQEQPVITYTMFADYVNDDDERTVLTIQFNNNPFQFYLDDESAPSIGSSYALILYTLNAVTSVEGGEYTEPTATEWAAATTAETIKPLILRQIAHDKLVASTELEFNSMMKVAKSNFVIDMKEYDKDGALIGDISYTVDNFNEFAGMGKGFGSDVLTQFFSPIATNYYSKATIEA